MTEPSPLSPEQEVVRRLLADARHDGPTPPEVVTRLDDTLADLVSERASTTASPTEATVVDLGARRRRLIGTGLLAAAAVVVAGVALGQALPRGSGSDDAGSAGGDVATSESRDFSDSDSGGAAGESPDAGSERSSEEMAPETKKDATDTTDVPTLSTLDAELDQELDDLRSSASYRSGALGPAAATLSGCDLRGIGPGRRVAAEVDGRPGVVVFRRPSADSQDVAIYVCGSTTPVRTLTLTAP